MRATPPHPCRVFMQQRRDSARGGDSAGAGRRVDGGRAPLLQRRVDAATHHADPVEHDPGDSGSDCVTGGELRNDTTEFPPLDGALPRPLQGFGEMLV